MAVIVIMPKQGQSVESCIITEINKKKGENVQKGEILFSYETDKASFEEVSPADGVVLECFYNEGDEVAVLENMMVIGEPGEDITGLAGESLDKNKEVEKTVSEVMSESVSESISVSESTNEVDFKSTTYGFISPRARGLAEKEAIDAAQIIGTGPNGRIIERDVKQFLQNRPKMTPLAKRIATEEGMKPGDSGTGLGGASRATDLIAVKNDIYGDDYEDRKISNMRRIIARSMHASLQNSAQLTHHLGADARRILELRRKAKAALDSGAITANITLNDMVCFAVIKALKQFPEVNTHFLGEAKRYFKKVHLGFAVDTERGLMVPVIRNADDLSVTGLSEQLKGVAASCRAGSVNPDLLSADAASFTVSNLGNYGVEMFTPVINLPQSAILGVNTILPRPKDMGDGIYGFVPHIGLSLTYDHRSLDGGEATRFLKQIATEIENLQLDITL